MHRYISTATILYGISSTAAAPASPPTSDPNQANPQLWNLNSKMTPEPIRSPFGATILGPQNVPVALQNADSLALPTTDSGQVPNMKWSFSLSHNRLEDGGWLFFSGPETKTASLPLISVHKSSHAVFDTIVDSLPVATDIASTYLFPPLSQRLTAFLQV